jgi:type VI secretion system protein ImpF
MSVDAKNRLQPALLDRLLDDEPERRVESDGARVMSKNALRQAVLRDLAYLLNAVQPLRAAERLHPGVEGSVLNFGLPPLSGQLASKLDVGDLERSIRDAILRFEPRILPDTLRVTGREASSVLDTHNVVEFEIAGHLWAQPVPLEMLLRTQLDLEAGQVQVDDLMAATAPRGR